VGFDSGAPVGRGRGAGAITGGRLEAGALWTSSGLGAVGGIVSAGGLLSGGGVSTAAGTCAEELARDEVADRYETNAAALRVKARTTIPPTARANRSPRPRRHGIDEVSNPPCPLPRVAMACGRIVAEGRWS
jgi:hypothetical protein